jgi:hypothetical protein
VSIVKELYRRCWQLQTATIGHRNRNIREEEKESKEMIGFMLPNLFINSFQLDN